MKTWLHLLPAFVLATTIMPAAYATDHETSPFALPLEAFQPHPKNKDQRIYVKPGVDLKQYHAVIIEPLAFTHHQPDGEWQILVVDEQSNIAQYFQHSLAAALIAENIEVVTEPGPGVARLRVAVSDILQEKPGLSVGDLLPIKAVFNFARIAGGVDPYLVKMATMAQLEDSESHDIIAGSVNLLASKKTKTAKQQITKEWIKDAIDRWNKDSAVLLARRLSPG